MINPFNIDDDLICEGIVGDGCGGGRLFFVENEMLKAYDPQSKESIVLLKDIKNAKKVTKRGCIVTIEFEEKKIDLDLSQIKN